MQVRRKPKREGRGRYTPRPKVCSFCVEHITIIDYKDVVRLRRYISDRARIEPRRRTGTCAKHQRALSQAVKRARHLALLPFVAEHARSAGVVEAVASPPTTPRATAPATAPQPSQPPEQEQEAEAQAAGPL